MLIKLRKPWFRAWTLFGWSKDTPGVGIDDRLLKKAKNKEEELVIEFDDGSLFTASPKMIEEYSKNHRTRHIMKKTLHVIPLEELTRMGIDQGRDNG